MNTTMAGAKGQLGKWYANNSQVIDRVVRFIFAFLIFTAVNNLTGYMKRLDTPLVAFGLALICAFLPTPFISLLGFALLMAHMCTLSLPVAGVVALLFVIMYALYFHFTPRHTIFLLLVPLAFWLKIPAVIPIAYGLIGSTALAYPIALGCIMYYLIDYIHVNAKTFDATGIAGSITKLSTLLRKLVTNKEMWLYILAFVVCLWAVSMIRKRDVRHSWKIATFFGALIDLLILTVGAAVLSIKLNLAVVLMGHLLAVVVGLVFEYLFFNVDYKHKETLQFEDDDYVYYVSAVPKVKSGEEIQKEVKRLKKEPEEKKTPKKSSQSASGKSGSGKKTGSGGSGQKKSSGSRQGQKNQGSSKRSGQKSGQKSGASKNGSKSGSSRKGGTKGSASSRKGTQQKKSANQSGKGAKSPQRRKDPAWKDGMTDELLMTQSLRRDLEKEL